MPCSRSLAISRTQTSTTSHVSKRFSFRFSTNGSSEDGVAESAQAPQLAGTVAIWSSVILKFFSSVLPIVRVMVFLLNSQLIGRRNRYIFDYSRDTLSARSRGVGPGRRMGRDPALIRPLWCSLRGSGQSRRKRSLQMDVHAAGNHAGWNHGVHQAEKSPALRFDASPCTGREHGLAEDRQASASDVQNMAATHGKWLLQLHDASQTTHRDLGFLAGAEDDSKLINSPSLEAVEHLTQNCPAMRYRDLQQAAAPQGNGAEHLKAAAGDGLEQPVRAESEDAGKVDLNGWRDLDYRFHQPIWKLRLLLGLRTFRVHAIVEACPLRIEARNFCCRHA